MWFFITTFLIKLIIIVLADSRIFQIENENVSLSKLDAMLCKVQNNKNTGDKLIKNKDFDIFID